MTAEDLAPGAPIDDALKPADKEDESRRAYFFCREIETRCQMAVIDQLQNQFQSQNGMQPPLDLTHAHKLLSCALIYCTAIDCGGIDTSEWLMDFFFTAIRLADEADPTPLGKELIEKFGAFEKPALLARVADMMSSFASDVDVAAAKRLVVEYGMQSTEDRRALLQTALCLPVDQLAALLQMYDV